MSSVHVEQNPSASSLLFFSTCEPQFLTIINCMSENIFRITNKYNFLLSAWNCLLRYDDAAAVWYLLSLVELKAKFTLMKSDKGIEIKKNLSSELLLNFPDGHLYTYGKWWAQAYKHRKNRMRGKHEPYRKTNRINVEFFVFVWFYDFCRGLFLLDSLCHK